MNEREKWNRWWGRLMGVFTRRGVIAGRVLNRFPASAPRDAFMKGKTVAQFLRSIGY
jgi:hypothetical protein